jgi:F-type H+-transporting ATPase subunit b
MIIDWFTIGAQAVNFLILVWLMKRFLYKPILNAIDVREKKIALEIADANTKKADAKKQRDEFEKKNREFDEQRAALLTKATDEVAAERTRLLDEARKAAADFSAKRQETLQNEAHALHEAIGRKTEQEVFAIARKTLSDLAGASLEERIGDIFIRRLREMDSKAHDDLGTAIKSASDPVLIRSTIDLQEKQRAEIQKVINEIFSAEIQLRFETSPDLIGGIELTANGQKIAWSITDYLSSLEKGVSELLKDADNTIPKPETKK